MLFRERLGQEAIYRREVRIGHLRHAWRRFPALCFLIGWAIMLGSCFELIVSVTRPGWNPAISQGLNNFLVAGFLLLGPIHLCFSLRSDLTSKVAETLITTGITPEQYLRAKFYGAIRPTFILIPALLVRWILVQLRTDPDIPQFLGMGLPSAVVMRLMMGAIDFLAGALLWLLGVLCYASVAMFLTLRRRSVGMAIITVGVIAPTVDVWGPAAVQQLTLTLSASAADWLIGAMMAAFLVSIIAKWAIYRWAFDESVEVFTTKSLEEG